MAKFTHYHQLDQMDCGPTCLQMIAKHYGRTIPLQMLREQAQLGIDGVSLLGIAEAAEAIGFRTLSAKVPFQELVNNAPLPCIIHWQNKHFVVLYKKNKTIPKIFKGIFSGRKHKAAKDTLLGVNLFVADPAKGLLVYSQEEFCANWLATRNSSYEEGIVLLIEPTPSFYSYEEDATETLGFLKLFSYLSQHYQLLIQLLISLLAGSLIQVILPFLTQGIVDVGVSTKNISFLYIILFAQLALTAGRIAIEFIRNWVLLHISTKISLNILSDFIIKLISLPIAYFDTKRFGDILQRTNDHSRVQSFLTGQTVNTVFSIFSLIVFSIILSFYSLQIFLIFIGGTILYGCWVALFLNRRRKLDFKRFDISSKSNGSLIQLVQGMQEIKLAGAQMEMRWKWEHIQARSFRLQIKELELVQWQKLGAFFLNEGKNIFVTFLAAQLVVRGQLTLGSMLALQYIIGQLNSPVEQLIAFSQGYQDAKISLERLNEIHSLPDEVDSNKQYFITAGNESNQFNKALTISGVNFKYAGAGNELVLRNVNINIEAGKTTAIVGTSGSGKTTLIKLLLKFYEPTSGDIFLEDTSLQHIENAYWHSQCGVVLQDGFIFSDTIARNIAVGEQSIDARRLEHAVKVANLQDFIDSLPLGFHTPIGAEGKGISQGQRQRIFIARAVYKNPSYIFFDEATNALDANNESVIINNLNNFFKGRTVIVVAHRLSTVKQADKIVVLHKGSVVESGTHSELIEQQGNYWNLVKNQLELGS